MSQSPLRFEVDQDVAIVTLDRPDAGNAINLPLARALEEAAIRCETDDAIRCVVITGTGKLFCGGGDVGEFAQAVDGVSDYLHELAGTLHRAMSRFMRLDKALVTLVNGPAAGAGMSLALAGDVVIAAPSARFVTAYGSLGLTPDGGMTWLLPRLVGMRLAQDMLINNRIVKASEALTLGMVTQLAEEGQLYETGMAQARKLAAGPVAAIGGVKRLLLDTFRETYENQLDNELGHISAAGGGVEGREGVDAFIAKRAADFKG